MSGNTVSFEEQQELYKQRCVEQTHAHFRGLYNQLKANGFPPDYILRGAWDCLIDDITADLSDMGLVYASELLKMDLLD